MAEYIDKEQVIEWFRPYGHIDEGIPYFGLVTDIREMKAVDVAPVRHGRWKMRLTGKITETWPEFKAFCTVCNKPNKQYKPPYCPHCGAKMDGGGMDGDE